MKRIITNELVENVKTFFRNNESEYVSRKRIADYCHVSVTSIAKVMKQVSTELTDTEEATIETKHGAGYMYVPYVNPEPVNDNKNAEGYNDYTASKAIANVDLFKSGDVYEGTTSSGFTELLVIIKSFKDTSMVIKLTDPKYVHGDTEYVHGITYMGNVYAADSRRLTTKPNKYITNRVFSIGEDGLQEMVDDIGEIFGFEDAAPVDTSDKDAEIFSLRKELIKKERLLEEANQMLVELSEAKQKASDVETQMLLQKVEIYERLLFGSDSHVTVTR